MVGIPVDSLWLISLDVSMVEKKIKGKKPKKSMSRKRKETKMTDRRGGHPHNPWMDLP